MAKLNAEQIEYAKAWLYDIFRINGIGANTPDKKQGANAFSYNSWITQATKIFEAIKVRKVNYQEFQNVDQTLEKLAGWKFTTSNIGNRKWIRKPASVLAKYIAYFCAENKIYWDDTNLTPYEKEELNRTNIGSALSEYNCFVSQEPKSRTRSTTTSSSSTTAGSTTSTSGNAPKNGFKSLGPLSGKVVNLMSTKKQRASSSIVYCIEADKLGKNTPNIFITPLTNNGDPVSMNKAVQVNLGSGNGYADCKLWWDNETDALDFLKSCNYRFGGGKFQNLHVAKAHADSNGYFEVTTEFGHALIKALKLNEEILEALGLIEENSEQKDIGSKESNKYEINNIEVFDEAFDKYRD